MKPILVQDHERALWCAEPRAAMRDVGIQLSTRHPKHSGDLSLTENVWALLRARLDDTMPAITEGRSEFIARLRAFIAWVNRNHREAMLRLARNMKERARDVEECRRAPRRMVSAPISGAGARCAKCVTPFAKAPAKVLAL